MSSTMEHFSHPKHPLSLIENDVVGVDATCKVCNTPIIDSPAYTCTSDDIYCQSVYLHKSCAVLPTNIHHHKHNKHPLALLPRHCVCDVCDREVKLFAYTCDNCNFDVCVFCAFEQRVLCHPGHEEHVLTLMKKEALFECDACGDEAKDSSYLCTTCEFWIHKSCALSPFSIPAPTYHHHSLDLIYSIPDMHRYFDRRCNICSKTVYTNLWMYYCHKCTYFVHMKCATSTNAVSMLNEIEADGVDNQLDLLQFPLLAEESLFHLIISQCGKFHVDWGGKGETENSNNILTTPNDPHMIDEHWSHKNHPLELQIHADSDDCKRVLICDGCIQPINVSHPSYYACIQCHFFLHSFCATRMPQELPIGASPFHPQHSLSLQKRDRFYSVVRCGVCCVHTNGFYYHCETCDVKIDIRCAFLPAKLKHISHKHHSLVQRPFSGSVCSVSKFSIAEGTEYACETCSNFRIDIICVLYPSRMKHKYDLHPITLRHPPFFYEGVFYCEICEEQVNNQWLLYHCTKCDHSFHYDCLGWKTNVKLGGTINLLISDQSHTLALTLKRTPRENSTPYICSNCGACYRHNLFFECDGCGFLACRDCVIEILGE